MTNEEIGEKLERLNRALILGRPIAMGSAFYDACVSRGLISMDVSPEQGVNPLYLGMHKVVRPSGMQAWDFQIGPPQA